MMSGILARQVKALPVLASGHLLVASGCAAASGPGYPRVLKSRWVAVV